MSDSDSSSTAPEGTRNQCFSPHPLWSHWTHFRSGELPQHVDGLEFFGDPSFGDSSNRGKLYGLPRLNLPGWDLDIGIRDDEACDVSLGSVAKILTARERAMMMVVDMITDIPDWQNDVFNPYLMSVVKNSLGHMVGLLDDNTFVWCIREVQDKAKFCWQHQFVPIYDVLWTAAKADKLGSDRLTRDLQNASSRLRGVSASLPDFQPDTNKQVVNILDPSLFPLVYGTSSVVTNGVVPLRGCSATIATGEIIPHIDSEEEHVLMYGRGRRPWSCKYQWLPSDVKFRSDGRASIVSYINNLHPVDNEHLYFIFAELLDLALPTWNACIPRTSGAEVRSYDTGRRICTDGRSCWDPPPDRQLMSDYSGRDDSDDSGEWEYYGFRQEWWVRDRKLVQPAPVPYDEWKKPWAKQLNIREEYKQAGLQVVFRLVSVELTPDKPEFCRDADAEFHLAGMHNEHIVATSIYFYDCSNVIENVLYLRQEFSHRPKEVICGECAKPEVKARESYEEPDENCEHIGVKKIFKIDDDNDVHQELRGIKCKQGRMIT